MLKILPKYFLRELMKTFAYVFVAIMLIIFVAFALQMIYKGVNIIKVPKIIPYLLLLAFPYSLPLALLASVIMTYGRFSGDNEILAIRSSGIHLQWITLPTILLGTFCSLFTLFVNGNLLPATESKLVNLRREAIHVFVEQLGVAHQTFYFPGWEIYVNSKEGDVIKDVLVIKTDNEVVTEVMKGRQGTLKKDAATGVWQLSLEDVISARLTDDAHDMHWMKVEKGMVPIPLGRRKSGRDDKIKYAGIFKLFRMRRELADQVLRHSQRYPDPSEVIARVQEEREDLDRALASLLDQAAKTKTIIQKLADGEEASRRDAAAYEQQAAQLQVKVQELQARLKELDKQAAAISAEGDQKEQEREALLLSAKNEQTAGNKEGGNNTEVPDGKPAVLAPDVQQKLDQLAREIKELEINLEKTKAEREKTASEIEAAQTQIKDLKAKAAEAADVAAKRAQARASSEQKVSSFSEEQKAMEEARREKDHTLKEAAEQQRLHEVTCLLHERTSLAFSCLAFVLIGIPLGIMCRYGHILVGFSIGIGLVLIYYAIFMTGRILADGRYFYVAPSYWAADLFLGGVGLVLMVRLFLR